MLTTAVGAPWPVSGLSVASVHSHAGVTARGPPEKRGWGISTHCSDFGGGSQIMNKFCSSLFSEGLITR